MTTPSFLRSRRKILSAATSNRQAVASALIPTPQQAQARLDAARDRPQPWLMPEAFEAAKGLPELIGPEVYRKP